MDERPTLYDILQFSLLKVEKRNVLYLSTITSEIMKFVIVISTNHTSYPYLNIILLPQWVTV